MQQTGGQKKRVESSSQSRKRRGTSIPIPLADSSIHRNVAAILIKVQLTQSKEGGVGGDKEFGWSTGEEEEGGCQAPKKVFFVPGDN